MYLIVGIGIISIVFLGQLISYINNFSDSKVILSPSILGKEGQEQAISTFVILSIGLVSALFGIKSILRLIPRPISQYKKFNFCKVKNPNYFSFKKLFWISTLSYLVVILFSSNTLIYRTESFKQVYGIPVPSLYIIPCCGYPGTYPVITLYLTEHLGLLITPLGLMLCAFIPILVGLNLELIFLRLSFNSQANLQNTKRLGIISIIGGSTGLLTSCPSCAGTMMVSLFGMGTGIFNYFNNESQMIFILITGLSLLYSVVSLLRWISKCSCTIPTAA
jgi:hypothetical protein